MDIASFEQEVRTALDLARESLGRIEMAVREEGDDPVLLEASRILAQFCMHARDYVTSSTLGRPRPRRFAERVDALRSQLVPCEAALQRRDLGPTTQAMARLGDQARSVPERMP